MVCLKGKKFGRLMVQNATEKRSYKGCVIWHCKCDCGNELDVASDDLLSGHSVSCGCKRKEWRKNIHETLHRVDNTCIEHLEKRNHRSDNTSGHQGVQCLKNGKYRAYIGFKGKRYHLGYYDSLSEAVEAREEAEEKLHMAYVKSYYECFNKADSDYQCAKGSPLDSDVEINE